MRFEVTLRDAQTGMQALMSLFSQLKPYLMQGYSFVVEAYDGKTRAQERLCHSCYTDLARDCLLAGVKADPELWKESLKYTFYIVTKDDPDFADDWRTRKPRMVPLIDGDGFVMTSIESRRFTKKLYAGFITFIHATGDARGVRWSPTSLGREWAGESATA